MKTVPMIKENEQVPYEKTENKNNIFFSLLLIFVILPNY